MEAPQAQQVHKSTAQILIIVLNVTMGSFFFGYNISVLNLQKATVLNIYGYVDDNDVDISDRVNTSTNNLYYSLLTASMPLAAGIGAINTSNMFKKFGRRKSLIITDILAIVGCLIFLIPYLPAGIAARFICGIAVGFNSAMVPVYINEITPVKLTGLAGSFNQALINLGIIVSNCICLGFYKNGGQDVIPDDLGFWYFVMLFPIITSSLRLILLQFVYTFDTPTSDLLFNQVESAKKTVELLYLEEHQAEILQTYRTDADKKLANKLTMLDMFKPLYLKQLVLGSMTQVFQQLSGINAITFYSANIYQSIANGNVLEINIYTIIQSVVAMAFSFVCGALMTKIGRKSLLVYGEFASSAILIAFGFFSYYNQDKVAGTTSSLDILSLISVYLYLIVFSLSLGPIAWVYNADILPEAGMSLSTLANWTFTFIVGLTFPSIVSSVGIYSTFWAFGGFCFIGGIYFIVYLKETFGLDKNQIQQLFVSESSDKYQVLPHDKDTSISQ